MRDDLNKIADGLKLDNKEYKGLLNITKNLFKTKNPDTMIDESNKGGLKKTLSAFDLIMLGIGVMIGSGIFTALGIAAVGSNGSLGAGPAVIVSMVLASFACIFSALCYAEFATMIPVAGSAYIYTYATMGEFLAWIVGWSLVMEFLIGYIAVLSAWCGYLMEFIKGFSKYLPEWLYNPPVWLIQDYTTASHNLVKEGLNPDLIIPHIGAIPICFSLPGILFTIIVAAILIKGIKESAAMTGVLVFIKLGVIALFVITGAFYVKPEHWVPFAPNGINGIFVGAFLIFFAYLGFDAVSTAAEETKNPQKNLPIGIIGSLAICTIVYILTALVLIGINPINEINLQAPLAYAISSVGQNWIAGLISIGALAGLTSVLMVMMLAGTRILYAMSRDGFLPKSLQTLHPKFKTPYIVTILAAVVCILGSTFLNISTAAELCNFGTFTSFIIVCVAVLILRKTDPNRKRPFKVPFSPWFPLMGIICCGGLMFYSMRFLTTSKILFPIWILLGIIFYFIYGYKQQRKIEKISEE